jgi:hypothetical protein
MSPMSRGAEDAARESLPFGGADTLGNRSPQIAFRESPPVVPGSEGNGMRSATFRPATNKTHIVTAKHSHTTHVLRTATIHSLQHSH